MSYYEKNKEKLKEYQKQYVLDNHDKTKARHKKYKAEHYELLKLEKAVKIVCSCGRLILKRGLNRHLKSNIHYTATDILDSSDNIGVGVDDIIGADAVACGNDDDVDGVAICAGVI